MMYHGILSCSLVISCVLIMEETNGNTWTTEEREEIRSILEQLQTKLIHRHHVLSTTTPWIGTTSGSPDMQSGFFDSIYKCPVLEHLLFEYFQGFPNISKINDDVHFNTNDFDASLQKSISIFNLLNGNIRVTLDELTENFARIVLDKRTNCPVTMFQQILVYALRSELNTMLAKDGKSLNHHVLLALENSMAVVPKQDLERVAKQIVTTVNYIVFESLVSYLQFEEFQTSDLSTTEEDSLSEMRIWYTKFGLDWFLDDFTTQAHSLFVKFQNKTTLYNELKISLQNAIQNYPTAMQCTSLAGLIQLHSRLTNDFAKQFIELEQSGMVMHLAENVISEVLTNFVSFTSLDKVVKKLASITVNFMKAKIEVLQRYEKEIITLTSGNPPDFLVKRLSQEEKRLMMELLKNITATPSLTTEATISRATTETKFTTPGGQGLPLTLKEFIALLKMDAHNLRQLNYWLQVDRYDGSHRSNVFHMITSMINMKEALVQQLLTRDDLT